MTHLKLDLPEPRETHEGDKRSWSQYSEYRDCAKRYQLHRLVRVSQVPGVWLSAGKAVHAVIEKYHRSLSEIDRPYA